MPPVRLPAAGASLGPSTAAHHQEPLCPSVLPNSTTQAPSIQLLHIIHPLELRQEVLQRGQKKHPKVSQHPLSRGHQQCHMMGLHAAPAALERPKA